MARQHFDMAVEQYAHWHQIGLTNHEMLRAIGRSIPHPSAGDVVAALAEAAEELEGQLRRRGQWSDAA